VGRFGGEETWFGPIRMVTDDDVTMSRRQVVYIKSTYVCIYIFVTSSWREREREKEGERERETICRDMPVNTYVCRYQYKIHSYHRQNRTSETLAINNKHK
jgi:hypothetical protein